MHITLCPVCKSMMDVAKPVLGSQVECPDCGEVFRVVNLDPLELYYQSALEDESLPVEEHRIKQH